MSLSRQIRSCFGGLALALAAILPISAVGQEPPRTPATARSPAVAADHPKAAPPSQVPASPAEDGLPQITVDVLMVSVPQDQAVPLLPQLRDPAKIDAAQAAILELVAHHEARLLDWPSTTALQGCRAVSENNEEQSYPVAFEQPSLPQTTGGDPAKDKTPAERALRKLELLGVIVPSTFETRNTGASLETEGYATPDFQSASVQLAAQFVELLGMQSFPAGKTVNGEALTVPQPLFRTEKISLDLSFENGRRQLIYAGKISEPAGAVVLFIAGARITPPHRHR